MTIYGQPIGNDEAWEEQQDRRDRAELIGDDGARQAREFQNSRLAARGLKPISEPAPYVPAPTDSADQVEGRAQAEAFQRSRFGPGGVTSLSMTDPPVVMFPPRSPHADAILEQMAAEDRAWAADYERRMLGNRPPAEPGK